MTAAHCGSVSALTLGLPATTAIPEQKGTLPVTMFTTRVPASARLKQRFANDIDEIVLLAVLRPVNTGIAETPKLHEILLMGIHHSSPQVPTEVLDHIAKLRRSGIVFACVHNRTGAETKSADAEPSGEVCSFAVRRMIPGKPGHPQQSAVLTGPWRSAGTARLRLSGSDFEELWDSLCAQAVLDSIDGSDFDDRLALREHISVLKAQESKLTKDHARAKQPAQRNEIYAKLHKVRTELSRLEG